MKAKFFVFFLVFLFLGSFVLATTNDAILYYSYDDSDLSGSDPNDLTSNGYDGINNGATTGAVGIINEAFDFDGTGDYVNTTYQRTANFNDHFSISSWIYLDSGSLTGDRFVWTSDVVANNRGVLCWADSSSFGITNSFFCQINDGTVAKVVSLGNNAITTDEWYHVVVTWDEATNNLSLFMNGTDMTSVEQVGSPTVNTNHELHIGYWVTQSSGAFNGRIEETGIYERQLSSSDILELYNNGTGFNPYDAEPIANFTVKVENENDFNLTLNGTDYTTSSGTIVTEIYNNDTSLWDFNITSTGYLTETYSSYNVSSNLTINLTPAFKVSVNNLSNFTLLLNGSSYSTSSGHIYTNISNDSVLYNFTITDDIEGYTYEVINWDVSDNYVNTKALLNITAHDFLNLSTINSFTANITANSFTDSKSTTTGFASYNLLAGFQYDVTIDAINYVVGNESLLLNESGNLTNTTLVRGQTINVSFYDQETMNLINYTTVSLLVLGDNSSVNYSITTGIQFVDSLLPGDYQLIYSADGYEQRIYFITINYREAETLSLYLLNSSSSSEVTITVIDQYGDQVENALVKILRYNVTSSSYVLEQTFLSNFEGKGVVDLILGTELYKFIVEFPAGTTVKETSGTYIFETTLSLPISTVDDVLEDFTNLLNVEANVTYNNVTGNARLTYNDLQGTAIGACLELYAISITEKIQVNRTCANGASGVILLPVYNGTYQTFLAEGWVNLTSTEYEFLGSYFIDFEKIPRTETNFFIYDILITITIFFLLLFSPAIAVGSLPSTTLVFTMVGFLNLDIGVVFGIQLVFIIIGVVMGRRG